MFTTPTSSLCYHTVSTRDFSEKPSPPACMASRPIHSEPSSECTGCDSMRGFAGWPASRTSSVPSTCAEFAGSVIACDETENNNTRVIRNFDSPFVNWWWHLSRPRSRWKDSALQDLQLINVALRDVPTWRDKDAFVCSLSSWHEI